MTLIGTIAALVILYTPQHTVEIAGAAVTGIGMWGMMLKNRR
jgi:hypothetical protein